MTNNPIISIIIPCYNQAHFLPETLDSVLAQTLQDWECVIVNDGSPDNTLEIANEYALKDERFVVVDKPNGGLADARNTGISSSHGKYILPLDSDDKIETKYIQLAVDYLENHPDTKLVYCKARFFGDMDAEWELEDYNYQKLLSGNMIFCSCVYRKEDYDMTNGYNPNMKYGHEDWDFLLSLLDPNDKVYRIPQILFFYRKHGKSMVSNTIKKWKYSYMQMIINHSEIYSQNIEIAIENVYRLEEYYKTELDGVLSSSSYKLGNFILTPLRWLKEIVCIGKR